MENNYLVQKRRNEQRKYRRKVTMITAAAVLGLLLVIIGLIKVIADEKKAEDGGSGQKATEQVTPGVSFSEEAVDDNVNQKPQEDVTVSGQIGEEEPVATPIATSTPTPTPTVTPIPKKKVAVDAGHGGPEDHGSPRPAEGLYEKHANLAIALYLKEELLARGYDVYMIREADVAVENEARPGLAKENGADIYVSIHLNSLDEESDGTRGAEVWYSNLRNDGSDTLAQNVVDELTKVIDTRNRGIKLSNNLIVLKYNELPACLVECGFMSSATERAKLFDSEYQKKIAEGIANGIEKFLPVE